MEIKKLLLGSMGLLPCQTGRGLPSLKLPWATYKAGCLGEEIYGFMDVRFGAKPERFGMPKYPQGLADDAKRSDTACIQVDTTSSNKPPGSRKRLGDPKSGIGRKKSPATNGSEDCLFLDIYVPASAFKPNAAPLPVIVWFYGGAYAFGSKEQFLPLYSGKALLQASGYKAIFVTGNYRLGAFGWLAGPYMEREGLPNAGLYDQALLLQWVQDYIGKVNGDKNRVSAWGESAGAGSILHHLIREDGAVNPMFNTFVTQSPAFEWAWDNSTSGKLDLTYRKFSDLAGCGDKHNITCLKNAASDKLADANQALFDTVHGAGLFPLGPSVDGKWIKSIPTVAFSEGKHWRGIKSAIVSHCANEAEHFTPPNVDDETKFHEFLEIFLPGLQPQQFAIKNQYNCLDRFGSFALCLKTIIRDVSFTCNTRDLIDAYQQQQVYAMNYGFPVDDLAYHASDLVPTFSNFGFQIRPMLRVLGLTRAEASKFAPKLWEDIRPRYLSYLSSFATTGDVNSLAYPTWPVVKTSGPLFSNVMKVNAAGWRLIKDDQNSKDTCNFWNNLAKDIMRAGGK